MSIHVHRQTHVAFGRGRSLRRRDFLQGVSAAALASGSLSWSDVMAAESEPLRKRGMACILLWMQGGPSQFETFSPKPDHENGGETEAIETNVPGIRIADRFPKMAQVMDHVAVIRSMTSTEGSHPRASFLLHTGYAPTASVKHPAFGSAVSHQIGDAEQQLPSFVRIGRRFRNAGGGGFLGSGYNPFIMAKAQELPANAQPTTSNSRFRRRLSLLDRLEDHATEEHIRKQIEDHHKLYAKSARMITSAEMRAFDLTREPESTREAYGESEFAAGCLLARRLVESGVTFVEVTAGNWDTHNDVFTRTSDLSAQVDQPFAQLIADLDQRGMLDSTLVVWMGEFGRTPRINPRAGRDHYPKAFNVALAGGGVKGGQIIGKTDPGGAQVVDRPVKVPDLFQSFCQSLKIDASTENMSSIGRPIKIVEGGQAVSELFS